MIRNAELSGCRKAVRRLGRAPQARQGAPFDADQLNWLRMIKDHIAASAAIEPDDFEDVPFNQKGGLAKARKLFGGEFKQIIDELNEVLVA